jgi:hypothetical protein
MPAPPRNLRQTPIYWNCSACKTRFSAPLDIFHGAHRSANYMWLSTFRTFTTSSLNCAGNRQKSYKIMLIQTTPTRPPQTPASTTPSACSDHACRPTCTLPGLLSHLSSDLRGGVMWELSHRQQLGPWQYHSPWLADCLSQSQRALPPGSKYKYQRVSPQNIKQNHVNPNVRSIGQGEAQHRKYKRLKLGGGQAYDRSRD